MIEDIVKTVLGELHDMAKSETVIGKPIEIEGITLIPVSKISMGFVAGSGDKNSNQKSQNSGTGGGATLEPLAFLAIKDGSAKLIKIHKKEPSLSDLVDLIPSLVRKFSKSSSSKKGKKSKSDEQQDEEQ